MPITPPSWARWQCKIALAGNQKSFKAADRKRNVLLNVNKSSESVADIHKDQRERHSGLSTSMELSLSGRTSLCSWESTSRRSCQGHHDYPPWQRKPRNNCISAGNFKWLKSTCQVPSSARRVAIKSILGTLHHGRAVQSGPAVGD